MQVAPPKDSLVLLRLLASDGESTLCLWCIIRAALPAAVIVSYASVTPRLGTNLFSDQTQLVCRKLPRWALTTSCSIRLVSVRLSSCFYCLRVRMAGVFKLRCIPSPEPALSVGAGNHFSSEALPGTLPQGQNSPQVLSASVSLAFLSFCADSPCPPCLCVQVLSAGPAYQYFVPSEWLKLPSLCCGIRNYAFRTFSR